MEKKGEQYTTSSSRLSKSRASPLRLSWFKFCYCLSKSQQFLAPAVGRCTSYNKLQYSTSMEKSCRRLNNLVCVSASVVAPSGQISQQHRTLDKGTAKLKSSMTPEGCVSLTADSARAIMLNIINKEARKMRRIQ